MLFIQKAQVNTSINLFWMYICMCDLGWVYEIGWQQDKLTGEKAYKLVKFSFCVHRGITERSEPPKGSEILEFI